MSTSFVVNAADLARILENIKIAERHAAGENLVDIVGKSNALLPMGLRTVDGSFNHLLPGQELVGAADQVFPRLIPAEYINELDNDQMPLGGPLVVTNTNYDPTIPLVPGPIHSHSVADADPRIISNLIVDQTINNKAAVLAALALNGITGTDAEAAYDAIISAATLSGSTIDPVAVANAQTALNSAQAAQTLATALNALYGVYALAAVESEQAKDAVTAAQTAVAALEVVLFEFTPADALDIDALANAISLASAAQAEAQQLLTALTPAGPDLVAPADVTAAQTLLTATASLITALEQLRDGSNPSGLNPENGINLGDSLAIQDFARLQEAIDRAGVAVTAASNADSAVDSGAASFQSLADQAAASLAAANAAVTTAENNLAAANAGTTGPTLQELFNTYGLSVSADGSLTIENRSADIGLSPANSGWMTLFGQFFDHGLDLVTKGGNGTVYIPLEADDPLIAGADKVFGTEDDLPAHLRFMTLTRATPFDANGNPSPTGTESQNTTTPFVDQNQTYTSSASHQVFLRDYKFSVDSDNNGANDSFAVNTGRLLNGTNGGIANWKEVKEQAAEKLGLKLSDNDVNDVPKVEVDQYGKFKAGANGFAQVHLQVQVQDEVTGKIIGNVPGSEFIKEGEAGGLDIHSVAVPNPDSLPLLASGLRYIVSPVGTGHAFLNDIAHTAAPVMIGGELKPDDLDINGIDQGLIGNAVLNDNQGHNLQYDNELLDAHFVTGDGRGNENIGLTAVHTVFHSEHNRLVEANKLTILRTGDLAVINEWLTPGNDLTGLPASNASDADFKLFADSLDWNGERLFQSARFVTEMQYQHLVFEEFARRMQPNVDPFVFTNSADLDPSIIAEFAHTVYRFGHSMLTDTVDRLDNNLNVVGDADPGQSGNQQTGLIAAFLNPQMFTASGIDDEAATGAIVRGMSRQVGAEIDEFVVEALRNNLLGLPLDLAALNLARGREQGIATLNHAREQIYAMTGAVDVKPYTSWIDFAQHLKHPLSIVNFIAAYGTHETITSAGTLEAKRDAAFKLVIGGAGAPSDRLAFLNGGSGVNDHGTADTADDTPVTWTAANSGLNAVDLWIGGLAEELNEFGGQLGSTFNFIFEYQMEHLQNGDRFYYLSRTQGMNLLNLLEPNNFSDIIMRNTDLGDLHATHLPALIMSVPDMILELDKEVKQANYSGNSALDGTDPTNRSDLDPTHDDAFQQIIDPKVVRILGSADVDGNSFADGNVLKFSGGEHVVLGGTEGNDTLIGDKGIDTLWGDGGDDYLNAGMESDQVYGGDGDDIIEDPFGDDFLRGEAGDDVIVADQGLDLLFGGEGQDFIMGATDTKEVFAGPGDDFILGGTAPDVLMGNEGDDWIEGGEGFDGLSGENSELFFNSPIVGHDILWGQGNDTDYDGENGDDIMVQGPGIQRSNGMEGFDWAIHKGDAEAADSDLSNFLGAGAVTPAFILRDRFDSVEGLSGWDKNDKLTGASRLIVAGGGFESQLTQAGVDRIDGLDKLIGAAADGANPTGINAPGTVVLTDTHAADGGEIILGGAGSDIMTGNLGNDIMDGDAWLNVRISVHQDKVPVGVNNQDIAATNPEIATVDSLTSKLKYVASGNLKANETTEANWDGKSIAELMRSGDLNPGQLKAVREILNSDGTKVSAPAGIKNSGTDIDIAVFSDVKANYVVEANGRVILSATDSTIDADDRTAIDAVTSNGDFITVTHTPPAAGGGGGGGGAISDGVDHIRNFEVLHFQDGNIILKAGVSNNPATGRLAIDITNDVTLPGLNVGDTITASLGTGPNQVADLDGLPPLSAFTFSWQFEQTPGAGDWTDLGETGRSLTLTSLLGVDGNRLRVVGTFVDQHGILETVFSEPTAAVAAQAVAVATAGDDLLVGTNGPDFINALAGDDAVNALAGNDIVVGGPGNDILNGGADTGTNLGDVSVFFGPISNFTFVLDPDGQLQVVDAAAAEEDTVIAFETLVFIDTPMTDVAVQALIASLRAGNPAPVGVNVLSVADILDGETIIGTANADNILAPGGGGDFTTSEFADRISGQAGDDVIDGAGGDDLIAGGLGDDNIDSGGGNDIVSGGSSDAAGVNVNTIRLRLGNETLLVGLNETGNDLVRNDGGIETISVGQVINTTGGPSPSAGTVTLATAAGTINTLTGVDDGAGNLVVTVNGKTVTITDHFNSVNNAVEQIKFNGSSLAGVNLGTGNYNLVAAPTGTTTLNGGTGDDALFGTADADTLNGLAGNDLLLGGAANDTLSGDDGNDLMIGGLGADSMNGGAGDDTYEVDDAAGAVVDIVTENTNSGTDTVLASVNYVLTANVENLTLTGNNINGTGNALDNTITGSAGNNTLSGLGGNDSLVGGAGNDTLQGGTGADILIGGAGSDTIDMGGNDTAVDIVRFNATTDFRIQNTLTPDTINNFRANGAGIDVVEFADALGAEFDDGSVDGSITFVTDDNVNNNNVAVNLSAVEALFLDGVNGEGVANNALGNVGTVAAEFNNEFNITAANGESTLLVINDTTANSNSASVWRWVQADGDSDNAIDANELTRIATINANATITTASFDVSSASTGNDLLIGDDAANTISGLGGDDTILGLGGDDTITWNAPGDGRDIVDGGLEGPAGDTFVVNGDASDETYRVYARADALAAGITGLAANSEIVVTRNGTNNASVIAELREIEEIVINTGAGNDTVTVIGNFNPTNLNFNTITVNDDGGTDTVDISGLSSGHRIVFNSGAGNDTVVGTPRPQDVIDGVSGSGGTGNSGGSSGGTNGASSFNFTANDVIELRKLVNGIPSANSESPGSTGVRDLEGTGNNIAHPNYGSADQPFIRLTDAHYGAYDPLTGNNAINPIFEGLDPRTISNVLGTQEDGLAKNAAGANIFFMAFGQYFDHGLDFLPKGDNGVIEIGGPGSSSAPGIDNPADLTRGTVVNGSGVASGALPQHLNKTSPFVDQNQAYGSTELVGQFLREGDGHGGIGSKLFSGGTDPSNPEFKLLPTLKELILHHWHNNTVFHHESLPGGEIAFRDYFTEDNLPLVGANDVINETLARALNSNFMGSGHTLIGDSNQFINILEHYVAGDLRANENYTLTSIHTIWARNHNFHVDKLLAAGFQGTAEELFQAAKIVNEAEYQKVVFNEFADYLIGGLKGSGKHGFDDYNPSVDAGISHEFAAAVYRVGHSLIGQNVTVIDDNGQQKSVPLFDVFLNPTSDTSAFQLDTGPGGMLTGEAALAGLNQYGYVPKEGYEQIGVNNIIGGIITQQAEEVDFNLVDAVRDDLVRIRADLFAFNVARGWDVGLGTLNQVRAGLLASTSPYVQEAIELSGEDLTPYASWQDFQTRNGLSNQVLSQFQEAYPDLVLDTQDKIDAFVAANPDIQLIQGDNGAKIVKGIDRVDLWVGGLAERHINDGMVGTTFWVVLHEQFDRLQEGDRFYYLDRLDGFDFYDTLEELKFSDIIARNTGLTNLPSDIFSADAAGHGNDDAGNGTGSEDTAGSGDPGTGGDDNTDDTDTSTDGGDDNGEDTDDDGVLNGGSNGTSGDPDAPSTGGNGNSSNTVTTVVGNAAVLNGTTGNDAIQVGDANHLVIADSGNDKVFIGDTGANVMAGDGDDHVLGGAGQDNVFGGAGNDQIFGEVGNDNLWGEDGDDLIEAGDGADRVFGGSGSDQIDGGAGNDRIWGGDGADFIHGGSGDDRVEAGNGVDVVWGDAGNDVFVFRSVAEANGDTIADFQPGDRIDLTSFTSGFSLVEGPSFTGSGELIVRAEGDHTIVEGNVSGGTEADFQIVVNGNHVDQLKHGGLGF